MKRKNAVLLAMMLCGLLASTTGWGQYFFSPTDSAWYNNNGQPYSWRLRPRTGTFDTVNLVSDPAKRTKYYISDNLPGYLEFLPQGYDAPENRNRVWPLILFLPGCGEIQNGMFYIDPQHTRTRADGSTYVVPANANILRGVAKHFSATNYFPATPTELRENGSYFSAVPKKTPGQVYNYNTGPTDGFIVMALMYRGDIGLCRGVIPPNVEDMDKAIDLARKLYRVDPQRVYMTGLSQGGVQSWDFPSSQTRNKLAGAVPVCSYGQIIDGQARVQQIIDNQTHIYSICNSYDYNTNGTGVDVITRTQVAQDNMVLYGGGSWLKVLNFLYPNQPPGLDRTQVLAGDYQNHDAWSRAYPSRYNNIFVGNSIPVFVEPGTNEDYSVYEWMLTKRNNSVAVLLPVHMKSFTATRGDAGVDLDWVTLVESNSESFFLDRSEDGENYSRIATLPAAGNSSTERRYHHLDQKETGAKYVYYRLSQRDIDGRLEVIGIRKVFMGVKGMSARVYPTIASTTTTFEVQGLIRQPLDLRIVDMSGRTVLRQVIPPRQPRTVLDVSKLQKGIYFIEASNQDNHQTIKFVKN